MYCKKGDRVRAKEDHRSAKKGKIYRVLHGCQNYSWGTIRLETLDGKNLGWNSAKFFEKYPLKNADRIKRRRAASA